MDQVDNVYYIETGAERTAEPTGSAVFSARRDQLFGGGVLSAVQGQFAIFSVPQIRVRLVPTSNRQITADYTKPGVAPAPAKMRFTAKDKDSRV